MINDFISKVSDLLSSEVRFSFLMPLLMALLSLILCFCILVGFPSVLMLVTEWTKSPLLATGISVLAVIVIIGISYFLYAVSSVMLRFWSGESFLFFWLFSLNALRHKYNYNKLEDLIHDGTESHWPDTIKTFRTKIDTISNDAKNKELSAAKTEKLTSLHYDAWRLGVAKTTTSANKALNRIVAVFEKYSPKSMEPEFQLIIKILRSKISSYRIRKQLAFYMQDQRYGSSVTIKGTSLGNIIQAYNEYSYKRYGIASEVFWPRIQSVFSVDYKDYLQAQKSKMDFFLTATTLSATLTVLSLIIPLLSTSTGVFWWYFIIHFILSFVFYRGTVHAALAYGNTARSGYDLFRFELIGKLHLNMPANSTEEKEIWRAYSQLVTYSESRQIIFDHKSNDNE